MKQAIALNLLEEIPGFLLEEAERRTIINRIPIRHCCFLFKLLILRIYGTMRLVYFEHKKYNGAVQNQEVSHGWIYDT